jgi:hypothetical protein
MTIIGLGRTELFQIPALLFYYAQATARPRGRPDWPLSPSFVRVDIEKSDFVTITQVKSFLHHLRRLRR